MMRFIKIKHPELTVPPAYYLLHEFKDADGIVCVLSTQAHAHVATWHSTGSVDAVYQARNKARTHLADWLRSTLEATEVTADDYRAAVGEEHGS